MTTKLIPRNNHCIIDHQPGNATRYLLYVSPGEDDDSYCVAWPEMNVSMLVSSATHLDYSYFHEKLNRGRRYEISYVDCSEIVKAIRKLSAFCDSPARLCTGLTGHEREPYFDPA